MKKLLIVLMLLGCFPLFAQAEGTDTAGGPELTAQAAVLVDRTSGSILYRKQADQAMDPASLTKMMTVYLALSERDGEEVLSMSKEAFAAYDHNFGVLWIQEGESMSLTSAAYASLLASANDTTAMLAEAAAGSVEAMPEYMNRRAKELGLKNTMFQNPFGLYHENNYTTAEDMALLTRQALKNPLFKTIFESSSYQMPATNMNGSRLIAQDCELIRSGEEHYDPAKGCKVGSTEAGGYAISVEAEKDNTGLIAVLLGEPDSASLYRDAATLLNYGFDNYRTVVRSQAEIGDRVVEVKKGKTHIADIRFTVSQSFRILLPSFIDPELLQTDIRVKNEDSSDPEKVSAEVVFLLNGAEVGSAPMEKQVEQLISPSEMTVAARLRRGFDYFCLGVMGLFIIGFILHFLHRGLKQPE